MHPLDTPAWSALNTLQAPVALGTGKARRFPVELCAHGAVAEETPAAYAALRELGGPVGLFFREAAPLPSGWTITRQIGMIQMLLPPAAFFSAPGLPSSAEIIQLTPADMREMVHIYALTRPGRQIAPRIQELGLFMGVREAGKLAAMGGLRLHLPGYREITTVATHPEHEGKGYATAIVSALARRIRECGEQPFLHVRDDNMRAIRVYERLGFRERIRLGYRVLAF